MNMSKISDFLRCQWMLITALFVAFFARLYGLTSSAIWHDEGYTMWLIRYNWTEILERTARDVHPPLYYFIAKSWVLVAGSSVFSIRFLSLLFSVGIVYLAYLIVKDIWSEKAAFWAALFTALSPFMVRFGQEARMYGVVAFFTTLAAYFFMRYLRDKKRVWLLGYVPAMIAAMYTQYYAFFAIISLWVIITIFTPGFWKFKWRDSFKNVGFFDGWWWVANIALLILYAPWFPVAYAQVTRISDNYWILSDWITIRTIPNNLLQFVGYTHLDGLYRTKIIGPIIYWAISLVLIGSGFYYLKKVKPEKRKILSALLVFSLLPMVLVYLLSELRTPIYQDRYFPFSAVAIFALWGILILAIKNRVVRYLFMSIALGAHLWGNYKMHSDVNHQMNEIKMIIDMQKEPGDRIVSGELYTFLDASYYLGYGRVGLLSKPVDGYGESSLFYDQQDQYIVDYTEIQEGEGRVWLIGRDGEKDYYSDERWREWNALDFNIENELRLVLFERPSR
jgi:mannosyltransferase